MSIYNPPTQDQTIFNPTNFGTTAETTIDEAYLDQNYLSFPVAQGTQTLVDTIIQGNITQTGNINLTGNLVVGSTNVITELTSLDTRLDAEEPKTTALQTLTEGHTDDIASNTADILTKQATITTSTDLTPNSITTQETSTSKICGYNFTKESTVSRMLGGTQSLIAFNSGNGNTTYDCGGVLFFAVQGNARGRLTSVGLKLGANAAEPTEMLDVEGNILASGSLTASSVVVGSTNVITELTSLDTRLDAEEPKTTALQTLTEGHTDDIASLGTRLDAEEPKTTALQTLTEGHTDDIASLDTRLDAEEIKITALQTLTEGHTDDIASNTADILTKQPTITTATDLDCKTLTTTQLEVNGGVNIDTHTYFDTIVIRRPTGFSGDANFFLGIRELQCWVNDVNILFNNGLTSNYALWSNPETSLGGLTEEVYNNITSVVSYEVVDTANSSDIALIITNIPLTAINTIQSLVLYSRTAGKQYSEGLAIELYKYTDLTEILATTNIISLKREIYRFDFPSIDTYTGGFATDDSITQIISEGDIVIEDALFTPLNVDITGDVVVVGDLTAENLIVGSTNVITEINTKQDIITDGSLTIARTDGLQTALTALQSNIDTNDGSTTSSITSLETQVSSLINFSSGGINFRAYYNLTTVITSPQIVPYSIEEYDSNNNYDITTYIFTIPIAGTYIFTFGWYVVEGSTAVVNLIRRRGGVETILQQSTNGTMTNGIVSFVLSTLVECLATDEIFVYIVSGSILLVYGSDSSLGFSGARISN